MKTLRRGVWGITIVLLLFLAVIPVVWATPEQSPYNQSIPTRTAAPPLTEPAPTPVVMLSGPRRNPLGVPSLPTPVAVIPSDVTGAPSGALPALPILPDIAALPERETGTTSFSGVDAQSGAVAGVSGQPLDNPAILSPGHSSTEDMQTRPGLLRWLFPERSASQPLTLAAVLGVSFVMLGMGLLVFAGRHSTK